jgi:CheY-like chemotaxis protein
MARRGRYEMSPVKLTDIVKQYLESPGYIQKKEQKPDVSVKLNLDPDLPYIIGSTPHLTKVIMNLVINAFDAMQDGGQLVIETSKIYLEELLGGHSHVEEGEYIALRVSDSGVGIAPEDLKKIFEPYYSKKKLGTSGSGLGLAVVYGIVKDHQGYYDVISTLGEGTTFILYFPVTNKGFEKTEDKSQDLSGTESLLIVDDSLEQRQLTAELLKSFGYSVETAENGHIAVEYLSNHKANLVVLDMIMEKGYDGLDTYRDILRINPDQKVLVMSGYSISERVNEILESGDGVFIKKPFTRDKIGAAVRQVLDNHPDKSVPVKV